MGGGIRNGWGRYEEGFDFERDESVSINAGLWDNITFTSNNIVCV